MKGYVVTVSAVAVVASSLALATPQAQGAGLAATPGGAAPGGPGAQSYMDTARKDCFGAAADDYQRNMKKWTATSTGLYGTGRYFIRLAVTGHPDTAETYDLGNGSLPAVHQRRVIDAGFLELTRLGELPASDPDVLRSYNMSPRSCRLSSVAG
jgi:glucoamylase